MNKNSNPLDYLIWCAENDFKPSSFDIHNAKDELAKLRCKIDSFSIVGWARINTNGDPYDLRLHHNPHVDQNTVMPLYYDQSSYELWKNERKS